MKRILSVFAMAILAMVACHRVPITGRTQLNLLPESEMIAMSVTNYDAFLSENSPLPASNKDARMISEMGERIKVAVEDFMQTNGLEDRVAGFQWEFKLVDDPTVNAWCMPGGKVVFYTGILEVAGNENAIAAVMGHEIAHAVARHGNERMSQALGAQMGLSVLSSAMEQNPTLTNQLFMQAAGIGTQMGMLRFSRKHESEADRMGLIFMSMAGYDPREAPRFWERMSAMGDGQPPEFLSTHPSNERRIADLEEHMEEALQYYTPR